jgi:hypothetical protein
MNTRHLYTLRNGTVIVLEHISTIHPTTEQGRFRIYDVTPKHYDVADTEFKLPKEGGTYITTERAELLKALAAI